MDTYLAIASKRDVRDYATTPTGKALNDLAARLETMFFAQPRASAPAA